MNLHIASFVTVVFLISNAPVASVIICFFLIYKADILDAILDLYYDKIIQLGLCVFICILYCLAYIGIELTSLNLASILGKFWRF